MIKLFVADDEEISRDGIRNCIEKAPQQYQFCGEAPDGEMALPLIQELKPDVLITDVRMPFVNGLELASIIKKTMPWVHIIILSGHDEFEYAQTAVSLGVDAYILKPVSSETLLTTLQQAAERIESEKQSYLAVERHQKKAEAEETILREYFFSRLVAGAVSASEALEFARKQGLSLLAKHYMVCRAELPACGGEKLNQIRLLALRLFTQRGDVLWFLKGADRFVFIIKGDDAETVQETAYETAQLLRHEMERYLALDLSVSIGSPVDRLSELGQSYADARSVTEAGFRLRGNKILGFADVANLRISPRIDFSSTVPLDEKLRHAAPEDVQKIVDGHFKSADQEGVQSILFRYYLLMDLIVTAARVLREMGKSAPQILVDADNPQKILQVAGSQQQACSFAADILRKTTQQLRACETLRYGQEIRRAKDFIQQNYADASISLHSVAKEAGFSPNHFSTIFSQETGETFVSYLTARRLDAAKLLLRTTDQKQADIAFAVGYGEPHYFSYLFKKNVGVSPRDYRAQFTNG